MAPLAFRLSEFLRREWPVGFCCPCLAVELAASVPDVTDAIQFVSRPGIGFEAIEHECRRCGVVTSVVRSTSDTGATA
jgi:hypothetical protein